MEENKMILFWENEDELPDMSDDIYRAMYPLSKVDFARYFPYIVCNGEKIYLITLEDKENEAETKNAYLSDKDIQVKKEIEETRKLLLERFKNNEN